MTAVPDPFEIAARFYKTDSRSFRILMEHGRLVAGKALAVADRVVHLNPDRDFVQTAAMLHDIGIFLTHSPVLDCHGSEPYIRHGVLGRDLLDALDLHRHGLVCERHVGVGISVEDIRGLGLPLPERNMLPITLEEQIICFADKFYSKNGWGETSEKSVGEIVASLAAFGDDKVMRFMRWVELFG